MMQIYLNVLVDILKLHLLKYVDLKGRWMILCCSVKKKNLWTKCQCSQVGRQHLGKLVDGEETGLEFTLLGIFPIAAVEIRAHIGLGQPVFPASIFAIPTYLLYQKNCCPLCAYSFSACLPFFLLTAAPCLALTASLLLLLALCPFCCHLLFEASHAQEGSEHHWGKPNHPCL